MCVNDELLTRSVSIKSCRLCLTSAQSRTGCASCVAVFWLACLEPPTGRCFERLRSEEKCGITQTWLSCTLTLSSSHDFVLLCASEMWTCTRCQSDHFPGPAVKQGCDDEVEQWMGHDCKSCCCSAEVAQWLVVKQCGHLGWLPGMSIAYAKNEKRKQAKLCQWTHHQPTHSFPCIL